MKVFVVLALVYTSYVQSNKDSNINHPIHPVGEYKVNVKRFIPCDRQKNNKIQINYYLNKTSPSTAEIKGNYTLIGTSLDDSHIMKVAFDLQDSTGGWSDNSLVYRSEKGCTTYQRFFNKYYLKALGHPPCPVPEGVYVNTGFPATNMENVLTNIPKQFIYGTYRLRIYFTNKKNEELACVFPVVEIKRPWET